MKSLLLFASLVVTPLACADVKTGDPAPAFTLTDTHGKVRTLSEFKGKFVVLEWVNHGCPFVRKHYDSGNMQALQKEATAKGVIWLSICSSALGKQGNLSPDEWNKTTAAQGAVPTAVLPDEDGKVGKLYGARTTPHLFVIAPDGRLIYQGGIDNIRSAAPEDIPKATNYVRVALEEAMAGKPVTTPDSQPYGCSVKY